MEIRQLEYLVAVVEEGGFGRAADRLHVVQSAVSQQIARLERELGLRLFERTGRAARLTAAGERLLPRARAALATVDSVRELAAELSGATGAVLRLGTARAFADRVHQALDMLAARSPDIRVEIREDSREARLAGVRSGALDAALIRGEHQSNGLRLLPLWEQPVLVAVPAGHPLARHDRLGPEELIATPVRLAPRERNPAFRDLIVGSLRTTGSEPLLGPEFTTLHETLAALASDAAAGAPSWTVFDYSGPLPRVGRIELRPWSGAALTAFLAVRSRTGAAALRLLVESLTRTVEEAVHHVRADGG